MASCGAAPIDLPWAIVFPGGGAARRATRASSTRRRSRAPALARSSGTVLEDPPRYRAGQLVGVFMLGYGLRGSLVEFFREPDAQLEDFAQAPIFNGPVAVAADDRRRALSRRLTRTPPRAAATRRRPGEPPEGAARRRSPAGRRLNRHGPDARRPITWPDASANRPRLLRDSDPLGVGGDFITAPEISQMFGELIGLG